VIVTLTSIKL